jgi:Domain of unknown function (DUF6946)
VTHFFSLAEITTPEQVGALLTKPEHLRKGRSAYELATSWVGAKDIPATVWRVLDTAEEYQGAELVEAFFKRQVDLRTPGRPSQTDLLAFVRLADGHAVIAIEGKVDEPFGPIVVDWNTGPGKEGRLQALCKELGIPPEEAKPLRYQLFHRAASAVFESQRYGVNRAAMLLHSFDPNSAGFADFTAFSRALGVGEPAVDGMTGAKSVGGVDLRLGWVRDRPS